MREDRSSFWLVWLSLFGSASTLVCCALPALLVSLGAGAAFAGLLANVPQLIWLSAHKEITFGVAGLLLVIAGVMRWRARYAPCPADLEQAKLCTRMRRISAWVYWFSVIIYLVGSFFAFLAADVLL